MIKAIQTAGIFLLATGACSMDSESLVIPVAMMAAGAAVLWITAQFVESN